jgi:N-acetylglucosamine-6-sulfatase
MRTMLGRGVGVRVVVLLLVAFLAFGSLGGTQRSASTVFGSLVGAQGSASGPTARPNIVVILTDDQRWDTLWAMPNVQSELMSKGMSFENAFAENPNCCPSRATLLTGQPSHTTRVWRNTPPFGGYESFDDDSTLATWLQAVGYRTGLVGKYLNRYEQHAPYIPPGWSSWTAFRAKTYEYYDYTLTDNGLDEVHGSTAEDYSTDVLANHAVSFIQETRPEQPLFLLFAPNAPHGTASREAGSAGPPRPAPRHSTAFEDLPLWRPPSWNEPDVSDKPSYIQALGPVVRDAFRKRQYQALLAVDDAVRDIVNTLEGAGRLSNTLIMFASDNGILWGEHRWSGKEVPYEESIRIPLVVRFDALNAAPSKDSRLVSMMDLAPTVAEVAGVEAKGSEGLSLVPALSGQQVEWRDRLLVEHLRGRPLLDPIPTYCASRTADYLYSVYATGERELYDLATDPHELVNVVNDPLYADVVGGLDPSLQEMCSPPPPGLTWPTPPPPEPTPTSSPLEDT